jgi:hypothetical protein
VSLTPHSVYIIWHLHLILYTSYLTPHSVYIISHLHLILYTSYVTYTSLCIHHVTYTSFCIHHMDIWCKQNEVWHMMCKWDMMYTEWGVTYDVYRMRCDIWCIQNIICHLHLILYTSYVIPHSVYIICHLHLILYTSYVTYTSLCIHHVTYTNDVYRMRCKWHMMYTEWGVSDIWCKRNEVWHMMCTEWGVSDIWCSYVTSFCIHHMSLTPHSVCIICHLHLILYTSYVTYTSFCIHHTSYRMRCKWHMMHTEWGVSDIWCIQNEV